MKKWPNLFRQIGGEYQWTQDEPYIAEVINFGGFAAYCKSKVKAGWKLHYLRRYDWSIEYAVWFEKMTKKEIKEAADKQKKNTHTAVRS